MKRLSCLILCVAAACVGPARTDRVYEGKAVETAKAVRSAVETARLAGAAAGRGKATGQYLSVVLGETEDDAGAAAGAFDSIQPPSQHSAELHDQLSEVIQSAIDRLREMRIAARRTELDLLASIADDLAGMSSELKDFVEAHE
jgi:hypothetical protein